MIDEMAMQPPSPPPRQWRTLFDVYEDSFKALRRRLEAAAPRLFAIARYAAAMLVLTACYCTLSDLATRALRSAMTQGGVPSPEARHHRVVDTRAFSRR